MATDNLERARQAKARLARQRQARQLKQAQQWLRLMREEVAARQTYIEAEGGSAARERARKRWLRVRSEWATIGTPPDEAVREARKLERTDQ